MCGSVLPHAVLCALKGTRLTVYLSQPGADFLTQLHALRHLLSMLFGQALAYDVELGRVPKVHRHYRDPQEETDKTTSFEWVKLDPINGVILPLRAQATGTVFVKHNTKGWHRDIEMIRLVQEYNGKRYTTFGYPESVDAARGWSYHTFMSKILVLARFAVGLPHAEREGAYTMIDDFYMRGTAAAQESGKRIIYGPNP